MCVCMHGCMCVMCVREYIHAYDIALVWKSDNNFLKMDSLLPCLHGFWESNSGHQIFMESAFIHQLISLTLHFFVVIFLMSPGEGLCFPLKQQ